MSLGRPGLARAMRRTTYSVYSSPIFMLHPFRLTLFMVMSLLEKGHNNHLLLRVKKVGVNETIK